MFHGWPLSRPWRAHETLSAIVVALVLGVGSAAFSVTDAALFRSLPYPDAEDLVIIKSGPTQDRPVPIALRQALERRSDLFENVAADFGVAQSRALKSGGPGITTAHVSAEMFRVLAIQPEQGTWPTGDLPDACVVSDRFWNAQLGKNPGVIGMRLALGERACIVSAVMPPRFFFPTFGTDVWVTTVPGVPNSVSAVVIARLARGVTQKQVSVALGQLVGGLTNSPTSLAPAVLTVAGFRQSLMAVHERALSLLLFSIALVFVASIGIVSSLAVSDVAARRNDWCLRRALGASTNRIFIEVLWTQLRAGLVAWGIGLALAQALLNGLVVQRSPELWWLENASLNWRIWALALVAVLTVALTAAGAVAIHVMRLDVSQWSGRSLIGSTTRRIRPSRIGVFAPVAVAAAVVVVAIAIAISYERALNTDWGLNSSNVLLIELEISNRRGITQAEEIDLLNVVTNRIWPDSRCRACFGWSRGDSGAVGRLASRYDDLSSR